MRGWKEWLFAGASLGALALAPGHADAAAADKPVLLKAERVTYDSDAGIVTADGNVEVDSDKRILLARQVVYNQNTDTVTAEGNVSLLEPDGNVAFSNHVVLTNQMRDGVLDGFRALIGKSGRLAAASARKRGDIVSAAMAAYTPCKLCAQNGDSAPTWDIKASNIVYDQANHRIYFHNARVELFGIPVLYSPILSHPDPSVRYQSGFLRPSGGTSSTLGTFVRLPYYIAIDDTRDATIEPVITADSGVIMRGEFRERWDNGGMWLQPDVGWGLSNNRWNWQSALYGEGRIPLSPIWRMGFDAQLSSSQTFLKRYGISDDVTLENDVFLEAQKWRDHFEISGLYFQDLRGYPANVPAAQQGRFSQSQIPLVLPVIDYSFIPRRDIMGGQFRFDLNTASVLRSVGAEDERLTAHMRWRLPFVTASGQLLSFIGDLRGEAWRVVGDAANPTLVPDLQGNPIPGGTRYIFRGQPMAAADWRWPFISTGSAGHSFVIQPIVQIIASPYGDNPRGIPNEDSADVELDDTDIFALSRVPGHALWESGPRANIGAEGEAFFPGGSIEALVGQIYRLKPDTLFPADSGLAGKTSDIVARYRIRFLPHFSLTERVAYSAKDNTIERNEVYFDGNYGRSGLQLSYVRLDQQAVALGAPREELDAQMTLGVGQNWLLYAAGRRDMQDSQMLDTEFGIGWENDCLGLSVVYERRYTTFLDVPPSTSVLFNIIPKFGGDTQRERLFPHDIFSPQVSTQGVR